MKDKVAKMIIENKKIINSVVNNTDTNLPQDDDTAVDTHAILLEVCSSIREGGYNPVSQIVGYIISEDPTHITNYKNARTLMSKIDRDDLLEEMVIKYIESIEKDEKNDG